MQENKLVGYSWAIFALVLATRTIATGLGWTCIPPFFNAIASEMHLSVMQIGMAWGMITLGALLFSLIGGLISDRIGIRWAGFLGLTLLAFGGALRGVAATYGEFLAAMFVFGGALGLTGPNFPRALGQWFPPERLGMVNGITMTGYGLGAALAMVISVSVLSPLVGGWRQVIDFCAALTMALAVCWLIFIRERTSGERVMPTFKTVFRGLAYVMRMKSVWTLAVVNMILIGHYVALSGHLPEFFQNEYGMTQVTVGQMLALALLTALIAQILGPTFSDRIGLRKPVLLTACLVGCVFNIMQGSVIDPPLIAVIVLIPFCLGTMAPLMVTIPFELRDLPQIMTGTAVGIIITLGNLGAFIYPMITGKIIDLFQPNYHPFFTLQVLAFAVISLLICFFLPETGPETQKVRGFSPSPSAVQDLLKTWKMDYREKPDKDVV